MLARRVFSKEFKKKVLDEVASGKSIAEVSHQYGLNKSSVYEWNAEVSREFERVLVAQKYLDELQLKIFRLNRLVTHLSAENNALRKSWGFRQQRSENKRG
jgi:transposase-like protein